MGVSNNVSGDGFSYSVVCDCVVLLFELARRDSGVQDNGHIIAEEEGRAFDGYPEHPKLIP